MCKTISSKSVQNLHQLQPNGILFANTKRYSNFQWKQKHTEMRLTSTQTFHLYSNEDRTIRSNRTASRKSHIANIKNKLFHDPFDGILQTYFQSRKLADTVKYGIQNLYAASPWLWSLHLNSIRLKLWLSYLILTSIFKIRLWRLHIKGLCMDFKLHTFDLCNLAYVNRIPGHQVAHHIDMNQTMNSTTLQGILTPTINGTSRVLQKLYQWFFDSMISSLKIFYLATNAIPCVF